MLSWILIGIVLGGAAVLSVRRWARRHEPIVWAVGLVVAALVYVGFAVAGGQWDALPVDTSGLLFFAALAGLGVRSPRLLSLGWGLHAVWDYALHRPGLQDAVPDAYSGICLGFDLAVALYALICLRRSA